MSFDTEVGLGQGHIMLGCNEQGLQATRSQTSYLSAVV